MKIRLFIIFILTSLIANAQLKAFKNDSSRIFYNKGVNLFNQGNFYDAELSFTKSLSFEVNKDAMFNRAITRVILKDTCAACNDFAIVNDMFLGLEKEANTFFKNNCIKKIDTIYYNSKYEVCSSNYKYMYYEEIVTRKCDSIILGIIHKKNHNSTQKISMDFASSPQFVDVFATYKIIDALKIYDFIFDSTFEKDNNQIVDDFKGNLKGIINSEYDLKHIPYDKKYISVEIIIDKNGKVIRSQILKDPFDMLNEETSNKIREEVKNSSFKSLTMKPAKIFNKEVLIRYHLTIGL